MADLLAFVDFFTDMQMVQDLDRVFIAGPLVSPNITNVIKDSTLCRPCPRGADCELGGDSVVALPGFWIEGSGRRSTESKGTGKLYNVDVYECMPGKLASAMLFPFVWLRLQLVFAVPDESCTVGTIIGRELHWRRQMS